MPSDRKNGFTIVELVIVIVIIAIMAVAFRTVMAPMMNTFFYFPASTRVNGAAADVLRIIIEGDEKAEGLRFAGLPCALPAGGTSTISVATATTLTYHYALSDACGTGGTSSVSVALSYNAGSHIVTRSINGAAAVEIPYYATNASGILIDSPSGVNFFRYYNAAGTALAAAPAVATIYRVDITVLASSGSGQVRHNAGQILLKAGTEIKRYTT